MLEPQPDEPHQQRCGDQLNHDAGGAHEPETDRTSGQQSQGRRVQQGDHEIPKDREVEFRCAVQAWLEAQWDFTHLQAAAADG